MGCSFSKEDENDPLWAAKQADKAIAAAAAAAAATHSGHSRGRKPFKILLLGAGDSGKSTVLKQMKILHDKSFTFEERAKFSTVIWSDAVGCMLMLIVNARRKQIPLECDDYLSLLRKARDILFAYHRIYDASVRLDMDGVDKEFLKNYLENYDDNVSHRRRMHSTGKAEAFDSYYHDDEDEEKNDKYNFDNDRNDEKDGLLQKNKRARYLKEAEVELDVNVSGFQGKPFTNNNNSLNDNNGSFSNDYSFGLGTTGNGKITKPECAEAIYSLWKNDSGIRQVWNERNTFQIASNADYYFDNVKTFAAEGYLCKDEDILKARIRTTGVQETKFNIRGNDVSVLDAGGQRSERKKWLKSFHGVTAVLFVFAVSEFDQKLFEDSSVNRVSEALWLLRALFRMRDFKDTKFIIFLNKVDILQEKLNDQGGWVRFRASQKDYKGKDGSVKDVIKHFDGKVQAVGKGKNMYVYETTATDTKMMEKIVASISDIILLNNLRETGMM